MNDPTTGKTQEKVVEPSCELGVAGAGDRVRERRAEPEQAQDGKPEEHPRRQDPHAMAVIERDEEEHQNEQLLQLSNQILELTKAILAIGSASSSSSSTSQP